MSPLNFSTFSFASWSNFDYSSFLLWISTSNLNSRKFDCFNLEPHWAVSITLIVSFGERICGCDSEIKNIHTLSTTVSQLSQGFYNGSRTFTWGLKLADKTLEFARAKYQEDSFHTVIIYFLIKGTLAVTPGDQSDIYWSSNWILSWLR